MADPRYGGLCTSEIIQIGLFLTEVFKSKAADVFFCDTLYFALHFSVILPSFICITRKPSCQTPFSAPVYFRPTSHLQCIQ